MVTVSWLSAEGEGNGEHAIARLDTLEDSLHLLSLVLQRHTTFQLGDELILHNAGGAVEEALHHLEKAHIVTVHVHGMSLARAEVPRRNIVRDLLGGAGSGGEDGHHFFQGGGGAGHSLGNQTQRVAKHVSLFPFQGRARRTENFNRHGTFLRNVSTGRCGLSTTTSRMLMQS